MNAAQNIIPLVVTPKQKPAEKPFRFKIQEYTNPRTGTASWRVSGIKRDGSRIRQNFSDEAAAVAKRLELECEYRGQQSEKVLRPTKLTEDQLQLAEVAIVKLGEHWERILDAVDGWMKKGPQIATKEAPRIDDAVSQFLAWMNSPECDLADHTRRGYRLRVTMFGNSIGNIPVSEITPATIRDYLAARSRPTGPEKTTVGKTTLKNDRRAICRFLSWCIEKEWIAVNPALGPRTKNGGKLKDKKLPGVFTVEQCEALLRKAESHKNGMLVPYVAVCLFAGLRPDSEAERITWQQVNLSDKQINIEPWMTKTGIPRTIAIDDTLHKWLTAHKGKDFYPSGWRKNFDAVKKAAGIKEWIVDGMRHTAHSHYFRKTGSYGLTAEYFGNSEGIVRKNYVNRVTTEEMKKFYAILPKRGAK
jgi:site-specific recombinase XerD